MIPTDKIELTNLRHPAMRTFHVSWSAFFICFMGWFGVAPFMPLIREEMALSGEQVGNLIIASVAMTVFARIFVGRICDRWGPRKTFTVLLVAGAFPVMGMGLAQNYESLLVFRLLVGFVGASFVVTQVHMSGLFTGRVVGAANATSAGWGNLGAGASQVVMPLVLAGLLGLGLEESSAWRTAMVFPGLLMLIWAGLYWKLAVDPPKVKTPYTPVGEEAPRTDWRAVLSDRRVFILMLAYGATFGVELTLNNVAVLYFTDVYGLALASAGLLAGLFSSLNIFARSLGSIVSDRVSWVWGLKGRVRVLVLLLAFEATALMWMAHSPSLVPAVASMIIFSLFVQMAEGGCFAVVPFVQRENLGLVAGIVGAGGNLGAVAAGFLFRSSSFDYAMAFTTMASVIFVVAVATSFVRFSAAEERAERLRTVGA